MQKLFIGTLCKVLGAFYLVMGLIDGNYVFTTIGSIWFCTSLILEKLEK